MDGHSGYQPTLCKRQSRFGRWIAIACRLFNFPGFVQPNAGDFHTQGRMKEVWIWWLRLAFWRKSHSEWIILQVVPSCWSVWIPWELERGAVLDNYMRRGAGSQRLLNLKTAPFLMIKWSASKIMSTGSTVFSLLLRKLHLEVRLGLMNLGTTWVRYLCRNPCIKIALVHFLRPW